MRERERERELFSLRHRRENRNGDDHVLGILILKLKDNFIVISIRLVVEASVNSDNLYLFWISFYLVGFHCTGISIHHNKGKKPHLPGQH